MSIFRPIKRLYGKLIHSHATPKEVAQGFALGAFIAMTPTLGLQTPIVIGLCALFRANQISAVLAVWITNPLTAFPIYYFIYKVGQFILRGSSNHELGPESLKDFFNMGGDILIPLWIGGLIIGVLSAILGYYLALWVFPYLRKKEKQIVAKISEKLHHEKHK